MSKVTLATITSGYIPVVQINTNFSALRTAIENTLSRDGTSPNTMGADIDLNSHRIINLAAPINANDAVRYTDLTSLVFGALSFPLSIANGGTGATTGPAALTALGALPKAGGTMTGTLVLSGPPAGTLDATTKAYVDAAVLTGLHPTTAVATASVGNITRSGEQTIDGVLTSASRVLLKNQSAPAENGIYVSAAGAWARATDMDTWAEVPGIYTFVTAGTVNASTGWSCTSLPGGTIDTTAITFVQFSAPGTYTASGGITKTGSNFTANIGTDIQAFDTELAALATTTSAADKLPYFTGAGTATTTTFTAAGRALVDDADAAAQRTTLGLDIGTNVQAFDSDLTAIAGLASTGLIARTGAGTAQARTLTGPAAGLTVTSGDGVSGNPTLALANDLSALEAMAGTGLVVRTGSETYNQRTLTGPAAGISVSNGDGISGNPTLALANDLSAIEALGSTGIAVRTGTDSWSQRSVTAGAGITITNGSGAAGDIQVAATAAGITLVAEQATTSGTSIDFTGIPSGVKRITIMFNAVSLAAGTDKMQIQIGDSGGIETSGYLSAASSSSTHVTSTAGFAVGIGGGGNVAYSGTVILSLQNASTNTWCSSGVLSTDTSGTPGQAVSSGGRKATSAVLDRVRLTTLVGSEAFDAGAISISYES